MLEKIQVMFNNTFKNLTIGFLKTYELRCVLPRENPTIKTKPCTNNVVINNNFIDLQVKSRCKFADDYVKQSHLCVSNDYSCCENIRFASWGACTHLKMFILFL
jgi:hypothetical protein